MVRWQGSGSFGSEYGTELGSSGEILVGDSIGS